MTDDGRPPDDETGDETGDDAAPTGETAGASESAPLSDLAGRVAERRAKSRVRGDETDELFESVDVGELDDEDVWTALVEGDVEDPQSDVGVGAEAEPVTEGDGVVDHVVPKAEFCQRCEFFAAPPELECTHEGTAIVDLPDSDHFRVRHCPMVDPDDE